ncbi:hypothetical protein [Phaffia rhodozyma]|uniref:Uncharacterized protein n=1 Tax=Phaffia rhodozyma TaxID=264483 RepID=A0A0F7SGZ2_PHARH|nr:hypothetical protein [Phaffia rhodozyma]
MTSTLAEGKIAQIGLISLLATSHIPVSSANTPTDSSPSPETPTGEQNENENDEMFRKFSLNKKNKAAKTAVATTNGNAPATVSEEKSAPVTSGMNPQPDRDSTAATSPEIVKPGILDSVVAIPAPTNTGVPSHMDGHDSTEPAEAHSLLASQAPYSEPPVQAVPAVEPHKERSVGSEVPSGESLVPSTAPNLISRDTTASSVRSDISLHSVEEREAAQAAEDARLESNPIPPTSAFERASSPAKNELESNETPVAQSAIVGGGPTGLGKEMEYNPKLATEGAEEPVVVTYPGAIYQHASPSGVISDRIEDDIILPGQREAEAKRERERLAALELEQEQERERLAALELEQERERERLAALEREHAKEQDRLIHEEQLAREEKERVFAHEEKARLAADEHQREVEAKEIEQQREMELEQERERERTAAVAVPAVAAVAVEERGFENQSDLQRNASVRTDYTQAGIAGVGAHQSAPGTFMNENAPRQEALYPINTQPAPSSVIVASPTSPNGVQTFSQVNPANGAPMITNIYTGVPPPVPVVEEEPKVLISAREMAKINKAEHKDNKKLAKVMKSEAKEEQRRLDDAIKELARLQKSAKESTIIEAKSGKFHLEGVKAEQKAHAKLLEVQAWYDQVAADLKSREAEHQVNQEASATHLRLIQEQTARIDLMRENKSRDDRERAEKLATMK